MKEFARDGLRLRYPENWNLDDDQAEGGWTVTVQSPGTAFLMLRMDGALPTCEEMVDEALTALRGEYKDLQAEPAMEAIAGELSVGHDIEFVSFDIPTSCFTRSFYGPAGTVLMLGQVASVDAEEYEPVLEALRIALQVEE
jgi:hypothetical protein